MIDSLKKSKDFFCFAMNKSLIMNNSYTKKSTLYLRL